MNGEMAVKLENPKSIWNKPINVNIKLIKDFTNVLVDIIGNRAARIPADVLTLIEELNLKDGAGEIGWKLISRALVDAMFSLIIEDKKRLYQLKKEDIQTDEIDERLNHILENEEFEINERFFKNPKESEVIEKTKPIFKDFMAMFGFKENEAENITNRLPSYFVFSLMEEWKKHHKYYQKLIDFFEESKTPFDEAVKIEREWLHYSAWLKKQVDEPMFSESFGLRQVYVPLRGYYEQKIENEEDEFQYNNMKPSYDKVVVNLENELDKWLENGDKKDDLRIISGGPGYGKSSFLKMYTTKQLDKVRKVLFIPLHLFQIKDDLQEAIGNFISHNFLSHNPLEKKEELLIIFDGLDELAMQGKALSDIANDFIDNLQRQLSIINQNKSILKVLLSGRDVIIQANKNKFRKNKQVLNILPYYMKDTEKKNYKDEHRLLREDQRNSWWSNYGKVKEKKYTKLPEELKNQELDDITAQPLLNYLVALSFERREIDFSSNINLNQIYYDLLQKVYYRSYEQTHETVKSLTIQEFIRILEEIGLVAWHGEGRTATAEEIYNNCSTLARLFNSFIKGAKKGVISLLTAFYFREAESSKPMGDRKFEFTHKSFGEYLTARKIVNKIILINDEFRRCEDSYGDQGWDEEKCLKEWIKIFGPTEIDENLFRFFENEFKLKFIEDKEVIKKSQHTIKKLIEFMLHRGMPMKGIESITTYAEMNRQAINCEKALLFILSSIARLTKKVTNIKWKSYTNFGEWISRLQGQSSGGVSLLFENLCYLNLDNSVLDIKDLYGANMQGSSMQKVRLFFTCLREANLTRAILTDADLREVDLRGADFTEANLTKADLRGADLRRVNFTETNLTETDLTETDLRGTDLTEARNTDKAINLRKIKYVKY